MSFLGVARRWRWVRLLLAISAIMSETFQVIWNLSGVAHARLSSGVGIEGGMRGGSRDCKGRTGKLGWLLGLRVACNSLKNAVNVIQVSITRSATVSFNANNCRITHEVWS